MSLIWYPAGQTVWFDDLKLVGGMIYSSPRPVKWPGEPSAIIGNASVARNADTSGNDLGYYPSYQYLTPSQRRAYLEWLARGRRDPQPERRALGYLFLFFYGLERRILIDKERDPSLIEELMALLQHYAPYHKSRSLRGYFLSLAHYGSYLMGVEYYRHFWPRFFDIDEGKTGEEPMKLVLENLYKVGEPMHWSIAYRLALSDQCCRKSVVVTRARQEFWALFQNRYENDFPGGMALKAAKQIGRFRYQPASSALLAMIDYGKDSPWQIKIANVAGLHSQFRGLSKIWNSCVDDLSGYSRTISSKKQADSAGLKAWLALPAELRTSQPCPMKPFWDWITSHGPQEDEFYFVKIGMIAPWFDIPERRKLTRTQANELVYGAAAMGWSVAPHPDHVDQTYAWDQEIVVYKRPSDKPPEPQVPGLVRLLYLVMPIAAADGTFEQEELDAFKRLVGHEITTDADWQYLDAVVSVLMRDINVALRAISAMTKHFTAKNRDAAFHLLVHIAAADGEVAPEEFKVLRKIARGLDLDPDAVERILREDAAFREITVTEAKPRKKAGEAIPDRPEDKSSSLQLDMDRIAALTKETHEVVSMLAVVMIEDSSCPSNRGSKEPIFRPDSIPTWAQGIASRYQPALLHIVAHDEMEEEDFAALAEKHNLFADDLFNSINAWADETLGDFLLERDDPIRVYRNLLPLAQAN